MKRILSVLFVVAICIVPAGVIGSGMDDTLEQLAKDLGAKVSGSGLKRLGVPEFTNSSGNLGGDTGAAGKYFAERVEEFLINDSGGGFEVIERNRLNAVLKEAKIQASGLTDDKTSEALLGKIKGLDSLVLGSVTRLGGKARVMCKVVKLSGAMSVVAKSTELQLDADLLTLFGATVSVPGDAPVSNQQIVNQALTPPTGKNPFLTSDFGLCVVVKGKAKPLHLNEGSVFVSASSAEEYALRITNHSVGRVGVALFIDGLNTIGQKRELASGAAKWILEAGESADLQGWQMSDKVAKRFVFVGAEESVAARQRFADNIGIITAAFFAEKVQPPVYSVAKAAGSTRALGTGEGEDVTSEVTNVEFKAADTPSAILTLRYENADAVNNYPLLDK